MIFTFLFRLEVPVYKCVKPKVGKPLRMIIKQEVCINPILIFI